MRKIRDMKNCIKFVLVTTTSFVLSNCKVENIQVPPTVITKAATELTLNSATLNGEVISEGGNATTDRGFVYSSTDINPTLSNQKIASAYGIGPFSANLTNLDFNKTYYYRAFATNTIGTQFGITEKFNTLDAKLPTTIIQKISNITANSVSVEMLITSDGGSMVNETGLVISTNPAPTLETANFKIINGLNTISLNVGGLIDNTTYFIRSYAKNAKGTAYSNEFSFKTLVDFSKQLKNGLIANYLFNGSANDESGNGINGLVVGATPTSNRYEINNSAFLFKNSHVYVPYDAKLKTSNLTVSAWINPITYNPDNYSVIINRFEQGYNNPGGETWQVILTNKEIWFQILGAGTSPNSNNTILKAPKSVPLNQWSLITCSFDGKTMKIFVNGIEQISQTTTINLNTYGTSGISIGVSKQANGIFHYFNGKIDDVGIWNRALDSEEIFYLFNDGKIN
jgi:hypothetical protein